MALPDFNNIQEGDQLPELTKDPITQIQLIKYAGASGDFNPIHTVPDFAKEAGLEGTIAHGMLVMGMLGQMLSSWAGIKPVTKYSVNFKSISRPGDTLTAKGIVKRKFEDETGKYTNLKLEVIDQNGEVKLSGKATVKFD
jgi:acyl dehydratase